MSLYEIFLNRAAAKHQNMLNSDMTGMGLKSLFEGVIKGVGEIAEQHRAEQKFEENKAKFFGGDTPSTEAYKVSKSLDLETGQFSHKLSTPTTSDVKLAREESFAEAVRSGISPNDLRLRFPLFSDKIDDLELAGTIGGQPVQVSAVQDTPIQGTPIRKGTQDSQFEVEGLDALGRPKGYKNLSLEKRSVDIKEAAKLAGKNQEEMAKQRKNFSQYATSLKTLISEMKAMGEQAGGLGTRTGIIGSVASSKYAPTSIKDKYSKFPTVEGQKQETILRLNSILTGQNRVIEGLIKRIEKTLPNEFSSEGQVANQTTQSIANAYKLLKGVEKGLFSDESLKNKGLSPNQELTNRQANTLLSSVQLTQDEEVELQSIIDDVLSSPPSPVATLGKRVTVVSPNGQRFTVPQEQLQDAESQGYRRVE